MTAKTAKPRRAPARKHTLELDEAALDAARKRLSDGAVTPGYGPWLSAIVALPNDALATELVGVLRNEDEHADELADLLED